MSEPVVFEHVHRTDSLSHRAGTGIVLALALGGIGLGLTRGDAPMTAAVGVCVAVAVLLLPAGLYLLYRVVRPHVYVGTLSEDGLVCILNGQVKHRIRREEMRTFVYKRWRNQHLFDVYLSGGGSQRIAAWFFDLDRVREQLGALEFPVVWDPARWTEEYLTTPDAERAGRPGLLGR